MLSEQDETGLRLATVVTLGQLVAEQAGESSDPDRSKPPQSGMVDRMRGAAPSMAHALVIAVIFIKRVSPHLG